MKLLRFKSSTSLADLHTCVRESLSEKPSCQFLVILSQRMAFLIRRAHCLSAYPTGNSSYNSGVAKATSNSGIATSSLPTAASYMSLQM